MKYTVTSSLVMLGIRFKCYHFLPTFSMTLGEILLFLRLPSQREPIHKLCIQFNSHPQLRNVE